MCELENKQFDYEMFMNLYNKKLKKPENKY
jgi:hypothetical protein